MDVGHRDFSGGYQVVVKTLQFEEVLLEFGKLAGANEARGVHDEGGKHLQVTVQARVKI